MVVGCVVKSICLVGGLLVLTQSVEVPVCPELTSHSSLKLISLPGKRLLTGAAERQPPRTPLSWNSPVGETTGETLRHCIHSRGPKVVPQTESPEGEQAEDTSISIVSLKETNLMTVMLHLSQNIPAA